MEIVSYHHEEIETQIKNLKSKIKNKSTETKNLKIDFEKIKSNLEKMKFELKSISDEHIYETFELFIEEHHDNLSTLKNEIEEYQFIKKNHLESMEIVNQLNVADDLNREEENSFKDEEIEKELFHELFENEKDLLEATKRLLIQGEETLKLADNCEQLLKQQDEEMDVMIENLNVIETNTVKAKKELVGIFKKLLAEKLIICLIIGLIIIICGVVLFKILDIAGVWKAIVKK